MKYPEDFLNKIICGDCVEIMQQLPNECCDIICTSPPYSEIRTYNGFTLNFPQTAQQLNRIIKPGGVICWIINDQYVDGGRNLESFKQALYFKENLGLTVHDVMIYQKKNFSNPSFNRYHQIYENILILSKGKPKTFNPIMDRKNLTAGAIGNFGKNSFTERDGSKSYREKKITNEFGKRYNIWVGLTAGQENCCKVQKHPAVAPRWLCRDLIKSWSNEKDIVLDPFTGRGTTLLEAKKLNRDFIGIEISKEYCDLAERYVND